MGVADTGPVPGETFEQKVARLKAVAVAAKRRAEEGGGEVAPSAEKAPPQLLPKCKRAHPHLLQLLSLLNPHLQSRSPRTRCVFEHRAQTDRKRGSNVNEEIDLHGRCGYGSGRWREF